MSDDQDFTLWPDNEGTFAHAEASHELGNRQAIDPAGYPTSPTPAVSKRPQLRDLLEFEAANPQLTGPKQESIRTRFGLSVTRYFQILHQVIDTPEALAHDAILVHRLRDRRDRLTRMRASRQFSTTR